MITLDAKSTCQDAIFSITDFLRVLDGPFVYKIHDKRNGCINLLGNIGTKIIEGRNSVTFNSIVLFCLCNEWFKKKQALNVSFYVVHKLDEEATHDLNLKLFCF